MELASGSVRVAWPKGGMQRDAKNLIKWCLNTTPTLRPSAKELLDHKFFKVDIKELMRESRSSSQATKGRSTPGLPAKKGSSYRASIEEQKSHHFSLERKSGRSSTSAARIGSLGSGNSYEEDLAKAMAMSKREKGSSSDNDLAKALAMSKRDLQL